MSMFLVSTARAVTREPHSVRVFLDEEVYNLYLSWNSYKFDGFQLRFPRGFVSLWETLRVLKTEIHTA